MSKLNLSTVASGFLGQEALNSNFVAIEEELQNKVLYRDNPTGEPNSMENDLDLNGHNLLNVESINGLSLDAVTEVGQFVTNIEALVAEAEVSALAADASADASAASASAAAGSASAASTSATNASNQVPLAAAQVTLATTQASNAASSAAAALVSANNAASFTTRMPRRTSTGTETLVAGDMGKLIVTSTASTLTLPLISAVQDGHIIGFQLNGTAAVTIQRQGTNELSWSEKSALNSIKLNRYGDYLILWADTSANRWRVLSEGISGTRATASGGTRGFGSGSGWTKLPMNTALSDPSSAIDTTNWRFVCQIPGTYIISGWNWVGETVATMNSTYTAIYKNGTSHSWGGVDNHAAIGLHYLSYSTIVDLDVADYIEIFGFTSTNIVNFNDTNGSRFYIARIR